MLRAFKSENRISTRTTLVVVIAEQCFTTVVCPAATLGWAELALQCFPMTVVNVMEKGTGHGATPHLLRRTDRLIVQGLGPVHSARTANVAHRPVPKCRRVFPREISPRQQHTVKTHQKRRRGTGVGACCLSPTPSTPEPSQSVLSLPTKMVIPQPGGEIRRGPR